MKTLTIEEISQILVEGKFDDLVGVLETEVLDFKDQPYPMDTDRQKYEMVEDITAFANHDGGIIVLGCRTARLSDIEGDEVKEIRPIPQDTCKFEIWRSVCGQMIYPPIKGLNFKFYECADDSTRGLVGILIPKSSDADRPHLIAHVISEGVDRKITTKYGLSIRTGARNYPYALSKIHAMIQSGRAVEKVEAGLASIEARLVDITRENVFRKRERRRYSPTQNRQKFLDRLPSFLQALERESYPTLVLGAFPSEPIVVNEIYDGDSEVSKAFDQAPDIRPNGFGLASSRPSELVDGTTRRVVSGARKGRQLSNAGRILVGVSADEDFLGWFMNRQKGKPLRYRSYVLAEVTYVFAAYVKKIFDAVADKPSNLDVMVSLRNSFIDDLPPQLSVAADHGPYHYDWIEPRQVHKKNLLKAIRVPIDISVERLAFETRACLYRRFGFGDEVIPYAELQEGGRITAARHILDATTR